MSRAISKEQILKIRTRYDEYHVRKSELLNDQVHVKTCKKSGEYSEDHKPLHKDNIKDITGKLTEYEVQIFNSFALNRHYSDLCEEVKELSANLSRLNSTISDYLESSLSDYESLASLAIKHNARQLYKQHVGYSFMPYSMVEYRKRVDSHVKN